jgi:succinate dehydrogenase / fumarate reductase flavoprotein subunit
MQGLADGYFVIPYTIAHHLAQVKPGEVGADHPAFAASRAEVEATTKRLLGVGGKRTITHFHRELGKLMWEQVGMARSAEGLKAVIARLPALREEFWKEVRVVGSGETLNRELERAGRVADFLEFGELMARDALYRDESCGGHFRVEHQMPDGEAKRDDGRFCHVAAWEWRGEGKEPAVHAEPLAFEAIPLATRSYK